MGTDIGDLVKKNPIQLSSLNGKLLGFDSYNVIYQFLSSIRGRDGSSLTDSRGNVTSHLTGLLYRTSNLLTKGIKPVFVFDGKPHKLKSQTLEKRRKIRTNAAEEQKKALAEGDFERAKKFASRSSRLTESMAKESKKLIELMGLPIISAPSDGEAQISAMVANNELEGCVSQDYDTLLFGAKKVYRNITISGKRKVAGRNFYVESVPELIDLEESLSLLKISREKLIWIGILVGTDFNDKFPRIGPKTALKLVKEFDSFEDIIKKTKFKPNFDYKEIEEIFLHPKTTTDYKIEFNEPKRDEIIAFLCDERDFSIDRVTNVLNKISEKANEKGSQSSINQWF